MEETLRWAGHYSSAHRILLVGEGDFSFSLSLATSFGSASNIVATSLDSRDDLVNKYSKAQSNLISLRERGATVLHGVDATTMKHHTDLMMRKFNRIVFNFPHAGCKGKEDDPQVIDLHRSLLMGFLSNASHMLLPYGEVHISHKTTYPYNMWDPEELASKVSLLLVECPDFRICDYPDYSNKKGYGKDCDKPFPLGKCNTFKFRMHYRLPTVAQHGYNMEGISLIHNKNDENSFPDQFSRGILKPNTFENNMMNYSSDTAMTSQRPIITETPASRRLNFGKESLISFPQDNINSLVEYFQTINVNNNDFFFYVIFEGYQTGVFHSWLEVVEQIKNYPIPQYKGFANLSEALDVANHVFGPNFFISPSIRISQQAPPSCTIAHDIKKITFCNHCESMESAIQKLNYICHALQTEKQILLQQINILEKKLEIFKCN